MKNEPSKSLVSHKTLLRQGGRTNKKLNIDQLLKIEETKDPEVLKITFLIERKILQSREEWVTVDSTDLYTAIIRGIKRRDPWHKKTDLE